MFWPCDRKLTPFFLPEQSLSLCRLKLIDKAEQRIDYDGLNSAKYQLKSVKLKALYTWITVSVNETDIYMVSISFRILLSGREPVQSNSNSDSN